MLHFIVLLLPLPCIETNIYIPFRVSLYLSFIFSFFISFFLRLPCRVKPFNYRMSFGRSVLSFSYSLESILLLLCTVCIWLWAGTIHLEVFQAFENSSMKIARKYNNKIENKPAISFTASRQPRSKSKQQISHL